MKHADPGLSLIARGAIPVSQDAAAIRGGATRLARRLRSERPAGALSSNKVGVLSHLVRRGPSSLAELADGEHHQDPRLLEPGLAELVDAGMVVTDGRVLRVTDTGRDALAADISGRDVWLREVLATLDESELSALREAAAIMTRIANLPGSHQHLGPAAS
jgi:hypothetical protein